MTKVKRFFTSIILTLALCATAIVPTYAAEKTEPTQGDVSSTYSTVWGPGVHDGGDYTFTDTNLTPEKVMGASGRFAIICSFYPADTIGPIYLTCKIINRTTGRVDTAVTNSAEYTNFAIETTVNQGDVIQLFFDASSVGYNPTGAFRKAHVSYDYSLGY